MCDCSSRSLHLTSQEVEVLVRACADLHDREIAAALGLSARTVEQHMANMRRKAGVQSRSGLIARAYASGVLHTGSWPPEWTGHSCLAQTGMPAQVIARRRERRVASGTG
jgi:DNA-binding CsgD family transcriptional regulator